MRYLLFSLLLILCFCTCQRTSQSDSLGDNPHAIGFHLESSDSTAISIADHVMEAMGGRNNWDKTRYLHWNFFDNRMHTWDKKTGDIHIEGLKQDFIIQMNIHSMLGTVFVGNRQLTESDSLSQWLNKGKSWWINDSYWLIMPFKLKDSGVTLKYWGQDTMTSGAFAEVLELTFSEVGDTPQNKYRVYIDTSDHLIKQWDFYAVASDSLPRISTPWENYKLYDRIKLSGDRGRFALTDISASDTLALFFEQ